MGWALLGGGVVIGVVLTLAAEALLVSWATASAERVIEGKDEDLQD